MAFKPGNKLRLGTKNPNAGRKPSLKTQAKRWIEEDPTRYAEIMHRIQEMGMGRETIKCPKCKQVFPDPIAGNLEALVYICNRARGKPRAFTELEVSRGQDKVGGGEVVRLFQMMDEYKKQQALMSPQEQSIKIYTQAYGADRSNWPNWAIEAIDHPKVYTTGGAKQITESVIDAEATEL